MAMQDAIALHRALVEHPADVRAAFNLFESARRGASTSFQSAAARSLDWYESVPNKLHLDPVSFAYDYMGRTGQVSHNDLRQRDPHFIAAVERRSPALQSAVG
jgi:2-polyprenyl-6-methoxyphenol hydroxylase-like FAD-dependent oxidoreductase